MVALRTMDLRNNFRMVSDMIRDGERVIITRPHNENLVLISEREYRELDKARRQLDYLTKLDRSLQQLAEGKTVIMTIDELDRMAK